MVDQSTDIAYIAKYGRILFRKATWLKIGALLSCTSHNDKAARSDMILKDVDGLSALQRSNWNSVVGTKNAIYAARNMEAKPDTFSPMAVVMICIDMSVQQSDICSDDFIQKCVREGRIYGTIGTDTNVIVQVHFKNVTMPSLPLSSTTRLSTNLKINRKTMSETTVDKASGSSCDASKFKDFLCVVMIDAAGIGYSYNLPSNHCEQLVFRCVSRLMDVALGKKPSMMIRVVDHVFRSNYDDFMYAIFLTSSCASETTTLKNLNQDVSMKMSTFSPHRRSYGSSNNHNKAGGIRDCKPSAESAAPTKVISNLRFLMHLSQSTSSSVCDEMLLDEINILDAFKKNVMEIAV